MAGVVAADFLHGRPRVRWVLERQKPLSRRIERVQARVLRYDRLAAGQIADAAIAEPPALRVDIHALGDGELRQRSFDVAAVAPRIPRDGRWIGEPPAVGVEEAKVVALLRPDRKRKLELLPARSGELNKTAELVNAKAVPPAILHQR